MLTVVQQANDSDGGQRSLLDEIVRDGARTRSTGLTISQILGGNV
ncbi:hypothetical protein ACIA48_30160 [Mycobacterium sp. NPDC051804]|jgi:hypothetical protein|nr:hypothetical protein [Mycolicibacterium novocastrense]